MADSTDFNGAVKVILGHTKLNDLQARGLVRRLLKEAGLSSQDVTAEQLAAAGRALLGPALEKNGVQDPAQVIAQWLDYCARIRAVTHTRGEVSNTVEAVFARMGLRD